MSGPHSLRFYLRRRWLAGLSFALLGFPVLLRAQPAGPMILPATAPLVTPAHSVQAFDLDSLRAMALARNTGIAAARASLAAAVAGQQGIEKLRIPTCLQPDLPYRRQQARLGLVAAEAGVRMAELQAVFGVQFSYVSYLYAREQELVARDGLQNLQRLIKNVKIAVDNSKTAKTDLTERDVQLLEGVQLFAQARQTEARMGSDRALSALREALGMQCDTPLMLRHQRLLDVRRPLDKQNLICLALANRPELVQASINVQVTDLEVKAQNSRRGLTLRTFASGADLHATPIPSGRYDSEYRPGAVGAEMPGSFAGRRDDRVSRASAYLGRAVAVNDRARGLITLEVEQAFLRALETGEKINSFTAAYRKVKQAVAEPQAKLIRGALGDESKPVLDEVLRLTQVSSQFRIQANEARYQYLISLITLERATGAAFRADLAHAPEVTDDQPEKESMP